MFCCRHTHIGSCRQVSHHKESTSGNDGDNRGVAIVGIVINLLHAAPSSTLRDDHDHSINFCHNSINHVSLLLSLC